VKGYGEHVGWTEADNVGLRAYYATTTREEVRPQFSIPAM
jgi:hypothetical protein